MARYLLYQILYDVKYVLTCTSIEWDQDGYIYTAATRGGLSPHVLCLRIFQRIFREPTYVVLLRAQRAQVQPSPGWDPIITATLSHAIDAALSSSEDQTNTHASI